jgi:hypothetical protein
MIRKNIYSRITESIVNAYHDNNLDSAMDDGHEMENMGKKIVAIITADPDQDLDWESEYEPFGATELSADDEQEAMEHEGMESDHELCPSCGYDVDCEGDECEDDENDDMEDIMIGGGFESEDEGDDYEDMDVKDILIDILQELKGEDSDSDSEEEGAFETSDENPMFGGSDESDDEDEDYEGDEDEDADSMLAAQDDWSSEESDDDESDSEEEYDEEEDFEGVADDEGIEQEDVDGMLTSPEQEEDVEIFDCLDNA